MGICSSTGGPSSPTIFLLLATIQQDIWFKFYTGSMIKKKSRLEMDGKTTVYKKIAILSIIERPKPPPLSTAKEKPSDLTRP